MRISQSIIEHTVLNANTYGYWIFDHSHWNCQPSYISMGTASARLSKSIQTENSWFWLLANPVHIIYGIAESRTLHGSARMSSIGVIEEHKSIYIYSRWYFATSGYNVLGLRSWLATFLINRPLEVSSPIILWRLVLEKSTIAQSLISLVCDIVRFYQVCSNLPHAILGGIQNCRNV